MDKKDVARIISEKTGFNLGDSEVAYNAVIDTIFDLVIEEGSYNIYGKGTLEVRERAARKGRNPQTGEDMDIPATKGVGFKCSKKLKERLN